jgi:hypothetical protein
MIYVKNRLRSWKMYDEQPPDLAPGTYSPKSRYGRGDCREKLAQTLLLLSLIDLAQEASHFAMRSLAVRICCFRFRNTELSWLTAGQTARI